MLSLMAGSAWAFPPASLKRVEPILLPDGQQGTMRIVVGDGLLFDRVRIAILDAQSRLIARGPRTYQLSLVCDGPLRCYGYDHGSGEVIAPDPATFGKDGPVVRPVDDRDDLTEIDDDATAWGVTVRPATWREWLFAEWAAFRAVSLLEPAFYATLGTIAGLCFVGFRAPGRTGLEFLFWLVGLALRVTLCAGVALVVFVILITTDPITSVVLYPFFAGVLLAWLLGPRINRRLRSALVNARRRAPPAPAP
ncbi:hypothetical protein JCM2811A_06100 [Methylorubrum rhodinum]